MMTNLKKQQGSAWAGIVILIFFVLSLGLAVMTDVTGTIATAKRQAQAVIAQSLAEAGIEKAIWRLNQNSGYAGESDLGLSTGTVDIEIANLDSETRSILATAYVPNKLKPKVVRKVKVKAAMDNNSSNASFFYGVQVGGLGITMSNNSRIIGNVYTDGTIQGGNNGSEITNDAIVSGALNKIDRVTVGGNAKAHTITNSTVVKDAYYQVMDNTTVSGVKYPNSPDPAPVGLPLSQTTIDQWEAWAENGNTYTGNYTHTGTGTLGPIKIDGDLVINTGTGNTLTLNGTVWVTGNVTVLTNSTLKLNPGYGPNSGMIIADSQTDKNTKGKITVANNVIVSGSGNPKSYILFLSTNTGSTIANPAILAGNNSNAVVYYSTTGMIEVANNARMRAVSGGGLHLSNGAIIEYDTGLANASFSGGPGGSWRVIEWQVVK